MKWIILLFVVLLCACDSKEPASTTSVSDSAETDVLIPKPNSDSEPESSITASYTNDRFREVRVERISDHKFRVSGKAQIFEANFSWVVEDGHEELLKGFEMTDAGAPEWGKFNFTISVQKQRENSTLTLILFESSAKDGSRQYELPITLY